ncbi:MAG: hypothetical protein ACKVWV_10200 [Planctomycetota bacterium]
MTRHSITAAFLLALARASFGQSTTAPVQEGPPVEPASEVPS